MNTDFEAFSDEELITRLRDGEREIEVYLLNKYKGLVKKVASSMYIFGAEPEDLIQEGMIGLVNAMRDYDPGRDASFFTFAELCISRQVYNAVTASGRKKHAPLNTYISLYSSENDGEDAQPLMEVVGEDSGNPEKILIDNETVHAIENFIENDLSTFERQTVELYQTGMGYADIARILSKDEKSTDNALQRARNKLKKFIEDMRRE